MIRSLPMVSIMAQANLYLSIIQKARWWKSLIEVRTALPQPEQLMSMTPTAIGLRLQILVKTQSHITRLRLKSFIAID